MAEIASQAQPECYKGDILQMPPALRSVGLRILLRIMICACRGCLRMLGMGAGKAQMSSTLGSATASLLHLHEPAEFTRSICKQLKRDQAVRPRTRWTGGIRAGVVGGHAWWQRRGIQIHISSTASRTLAQKWLHKQCILLWSGNCGRQTYRQRWRPSWKIAFSIYFRLYQGVHHGSTCIQSYLQ